MKIIILTILVCFWITLSGTILEVGLEDNFLYHEIQHAIDESTHGDTVLVYPGLYCENINYEGKDVFVSSLYHIYDDNNYIHNTIIDGNNSGTVVCFNNNETNAATLTGFTIQNGTGKQISTNLTAGGGIYINFSSPSLISNIITQNSACSGGGISLSSTNSYLEDLTITGNHGFLNSGGILINNEAPDPIISYVTFDSENRCNIYNNTAASMSDILIVHSIDYITPIYLNIFSVENPGWDYVSQYPNFNLQFDSTWLIPVDSDLYVSTSGDNGNTGLSPNSPLRTISYALSKIEADSLNLRTIHLAAGTYSPDTNGELAGINAKAYVTVKGSGTENTILEFPDTILSIVRCHYDEFAKFMDLSIKNTNNSTDPAFRIQETNTLFKNIKFENINVDYGPSCISTTSGFTLNNVEFINNTGRAVVANNLTGGYQKASIENTKFISNNNPDNQSSGGAMTITNYDYVPFFNCLIGNNEAYDNFWIQPQIYLINCDTVNFVNNTVYGNYNNGGAIHIGGSINDGIPSEVNTVNIVNSIIYNNSAYVFQTERGEVPTIVNISNSIIQGGIDPSIIHIAGSEPYPVEFNYGNNIIDQDPLLVAGEDQNSIEYYELMSNSPAIDNGITYSEFGFVTPEFDLLGNPRIYGENIDIGCIEWSGTNFTNNSIILNDFQMYNYPNPFNPDTRIYFNVPDEGHVKLEIFNVKGQKVTTLADAQTSAGRFEAVWRGCDNNSKQVASGHYFAKLTLNGVDKAKTKLTLLK